MGVIVLLASLALAEQPAPPAPEPSREDRSDFLAGDVDLRLALGFDGVEPAPWTIVTSFVGWNSLQLGVDAALLTSDEATLSVGVEAFYSKPLIHRWMSEYLFAGNAFNAALDWRATDRGALARAALHINSFSSVGAYGAFLLGPSFYTFEAERLEGPNAGTIARLDAFGLRMGAAGGLISVSEGGFFGGAELRYLINARFRSVKKLYVGEGLTAEVFDLGSRHTGPSGFAWSLFLGRRF